MSLLTIVVDACGRVGVPAPSSVISSADNTVKQMKALCDQEVKDLGRAHSWQALQRENTWIATATEEQSGVIPMDFDRFIPYTMFNRTRNRIVSGPLTPTEWQDLKSRSATVVYDAFRQRANKLLFMPTPTAGQEYVFEYVTCYAISNAGGTEGKLKFTADGDYPLVDEELVTLGLIWRWYRAKGLDYSEAFTSYEAMKRELMSRDGGQRGADLGKFSGWRGPRFPLFPDSSWNVS